LSAVLATAGAQSLRSQIETTTKAIRKSMIAMDIKGFTKIMKGVVATNFTYVESGKTMDFDHMVQGVGMGFSQMEKVTKADAKLLALTEKGNSATSTTQHTMESTTTMGGPKRHKMSFSGVSTETYVRQGGAWKMSKMVWNNQSMLVDGKAMSPKMAGTANSH
jgi:hypothetical protein